MNLIFLSRGKKKEREVIKKPGENLRIRIPKIAINCKNSRWKKRDSYSSTLDFYSNLVPIRYSSVPEERGGKTHAERERERSSCRFDNSLASGETIPRGGLGRHNKSPSTVDVTKMNCYIVLTNEGRDRRSAPVSPPSR